MGKIFCVIGKSATGKDTVYERLLQDNELPVNRLIPYTTRPIREGETEGETYHFCTEEMVKSLEEQGKIIELRAYNTVYGVWKYFTVDDDQIDLEKHNYMLIGTIEMYVQIRDYYGEDKVLPIYIEVEDGERLIRAISREKTQSVPKYEEMCRRFLADQKDFSEEKIKEARIEKRFENIELEDTIEIIKRYIQSMV
ncbi:MAG: guanylate kinase [Agathobacter sp.]|nr:guanylate kinase [Agathobacter sp.]